MTTTATRWDFARRLYRAVIDLLNRRPVVIGADMASGPDSTAVMVIGPSGRAKLIPRATADRLVAAGKLSRAESVEVAREAMGLPKAIQMTAESDHTAGKE